MKRSILFLTPFLLFSLALPACASPNNREATPMAQLSTEVPQPTDTAIPPTPTSFPTATVQPTKTALPPTPTSLLTATAALAPHFDRFPAPVQFDGGGNSLVGLVQGENGWQMATVDYPPNADILNSDYAPATNRLLAWRFYGGAGPSNLGVGSLSLIDLATQAEEVAVPADVVSAGWAPNGLDFAYILATPTTYELRWRAADGSDRLLAADVPHSLRISPDGRSVAFTRESHYEGLSAVPGLYVVNIATGAETQVSPLDRAGYGGGGPFWKPHWSPDSSQLLLYAVSDDDRAPEPHEAGYAWAAADGRFSHFLPESAFLAQVAIPRRDPEAVPCLDTPVLFAANTIVLGVGECLPMVGDPQASQPAQFAMDPQTGALVLVGLLPAADPGQLLSWDVPGESVLLQEGDQIVSRPLSEAAE